MRAWFLGLFSIDGLMSGLLMFGFFSWFGELKAEADFGHFCLMAQHYFGRATLEIGWDFSYLFFILNFVGG